MALSDIFLSNNIGGLEQTKGEKITSPDASFTLTDETIVFVNRDIEVTLENPYYGKSVEFYVDYSAHLRLIGNDTLIYGAIIGNHPKVLCNTPVFDISRPCYIKLIFDGTRWRLTGQLND